MTRRQQATASASVLVLGQPISAKQLRGILADPGLSFAAKGVLALVLTRPPGAVISTGELFATSADPMPLVERAVAELVQAGLLATTRPGRAAGTAAGGVVFGRSRRAPRKGGG
jgi:hypothetical protein